MRSGKHQQGYELLSMRDEVGQSSSSVSGLSPSDQFAGSLVAAEAATRRTAGANAREDDQSKSNWPSTAAVLTTGLGGVALGASLGANVSLSQRNTTLASKLKECQTPSTATGGTTSPAPTVEPTSVGSITTSHVTVTQTPSTSGK